MSKNTATSIKVQPPYHLRYFILKCALNIPKPVNVITGYDRTNTHRVTISDAQFELILLPLQDETNFAGLIQLLIELDINQTYKRKVMKAANVLLTAETILSLMTRCNG